jgi:DNA-binding CsgD family transcriptional regulator
MGFAGFTDTELKVIALRTNGTKPAQIALQLGCHYNTVLNALKRVYAKVGFTDLPLLTRWAMQHGLDELLGPEGPETRPYPRMPDASASSKAGCGEPRKHAGGQAGRSE